jgi:rRNA maturation endonuclease Nob1
MGKLVSGRSSYKAVLEKTKPAIKCPKCGKILTGEEKFCPECGHKLK